MKTTTIVQVLCLFCFASILMLAPGCSCQDACPERQNTTIVPYDDDDSVQDDDDSAQDDDDTGSDDDDDDDTTPVDQDLIFIGSDDLNGNPVLAVWDGAEWNDRQLDFPSLTENFPVDAPITDIVLTDPDHGYMLAHGIFELDENGIWNFIKPSSPPAVVWSVSQVSAPTENWAVFGGQYLSIDGKEQPLVLIRDSGSWTHFNLTGPGNCEILDITGVSSKKAWLCGICIDEERSETRFAMEYTNGSWQDFTPPEGIGINGMIAVETEGDIHLFTYGGGIFEYFEGVWNEIIIDDKSSDVIDVDAGGTFLAMATDKNLYLYDGEWTRYFIHLSYREYHFHNIEMVAPDNIYALGEKRLEPGDSVPLIMHFDGSEWTEMDLAGTALETGEIVDGDFADAENAWFVVNFEMDGHLIEFVEDVFQSPIRPTRISSHKHIIDAAFGDDGTFLAIGSFQKQPAVLEETGEGWTLALLPGEIGYTQAVASSSLGTFAASGNLFQRVADGWTQIDLSPFGDDAVPVLLSANNFRVVAAGDFGALIVNDGDGWYLVPLPEDMMWDYVTLNSVALAGQDIWATGFRVYGEAYDNFLVRCDAENRITWWSASDLGIGFGKAFSNAIAVLPPSGPIFFGGTFFDEVHLTDLPILYQRTDDGTVVEQSIEYSTDKNRRLESLAVAENDVYGLCSEEMTYSTEYLPYYHPRPLVIHKVGESWESLPTTGLPQFGSGRIVAGKMPF